MASSRATSRRRAGSALALVFAAAVLLHGLGCGDGSEDGDGEPGPTSTPACQGLGEECLSGLEMCCEPGFCVPTDENQVFGICIAPPPDDGDGDGDGNGDGDA